MPRQTSDTSSTLSPAHAWCLWLRGHLCRLRLQPACTQKRRMRSSKVELILRRTIKIGFPTASTGTSLMATKQAKASHLLTCLLLQACCQLVIEPDGKIRGALPTLSYQVHTFRGLCQLRCQSALRRSSSFGRLRLGGAQVRIGCTTQLSGLQSTLF